METQINDMKMSIADLKSMMSDIKLERQEEFQDLIISLEQNINIIDEYLKK